MLKHNQRMRFNQSMILFWKANLLIKSNDKDYSSQNNVNILFEALHKNPGFSKNCNVILKITAYFSILLKVALHLKLKGSVNGKLFKATRANKMKQSFSSHGY